MNSLMKQLDEEKSEKEVLRAELVRTQQQLVESRSSAKNSKEISRQSEDRVHKIHQEMIDSNT